MKVLLDASGLTLQEIPKGIIPVYAIADLSLDAKGLTLDEFIAYSQERLIVLDAEALIRERDRARKLCFIRTVLERTNALILFSDLSVLELLMRAQETKRGIFSSTTLISSRADAEAYGAFGCAIGLSLELSLEELHAFQSFTYPLELDLFGYRPYLVTPRKSVSVMNEMTGRSMMKSGLLRPDNHALSLHLEENARGTIIYSDMPFAVRREVINLLKPAFGRIRAYGLLPRLRIEVARLYANGKDTHDLPSDLCGALRDAFPKASASEVES